MMNNKHIVILNHGLHISGVSRALVNLANLLAAHGYRITIKLASAQFDLADELDPRVQLSLFLPGFVNSSGFRLRIYGKLMQMVSWLPRKLQWFLFVGFGHDVEIAFNRGMSVAIVSHSMSAKSIKIAWVHSDFMQDCNPRAGFNCDADAVAGYSRYNRVVCVSQHVKSSFIQHFEDTGNLIVCHNVIDCCKIRRMSAEPFVFDVKIKHFSIVAVGRLTKAKNYELLIEVARLMEAAEEACSFYIIGDGELKQILLHKASDVLSVKFLGSTSNPYPLMASADAYLSTSIFEGLSTTVIEAMILGLPVVVTDCCGMREIVGDSQWGQLCSFNPEQIASSLSRLIADHNYYEQQKRKSLQRGEWLATNEQILSLFTQL
mgnify:CR=1 FL=1